MYTSTPTQFVPMSRVTQDCPLYVNHLTQWLCLCSAGCIAVWRRHALLLSGKAPTVWTLLSQPFCCWVNGIFMVGFTFHGENRTNFSREFLEFGGQSCASMDLALVAKLPLLYPTFLGPRVTLTFRWLRIN